MNDELLIGVTARKSEAAWVARWAGNYIARLRELGATPVLLAPDAPALLLPADAPITALPTTALPNTALPSAAAAPAADAPTRHRTAAATPPAASPGASPAQATPAVGIPFAPTGHPFHPDGAGRFAPALLAHLHGLVLCGGGDVHPRRYGRPLDGTDDHSIDEARDEMEMALCAAALEHDLPLFAICRGFQLLNVVAGGQLVQHIDSHRSDPDAPRVHDVAVAPGSRLATLVGAGRLPVNTYHHQGVDRTTLAPLLRPTAFDAQQGWLIEAAESPHHRWVQGVQWHPERIGDFPLPAGQRALWAGFVEAAQAHRSAQAAPPRAASADRAAAETPTATAPTAASATPATSAAPHA
jgi:putative glutamine amidotransferase